MRQIAYVVAFVLLLAVILVGAFLGGRLLVERVRQDFQPRLEWTPPVAPVSPAPEVTPDAATPQPPPARTAAVIPTPAAPKPEPLTTPAPPPPAPTEAVLPEAADTQEVPGATEVPTSTPPPVASEPFQPLGPVRTSRGDCAGTYVLGTVTDRSGAPIPGVRLRLVDEFANEAVAITKAGQADLGRYDFPLAGPPRQFSLAIVDDGGAPLSQSVGFAFYGDAPDAEATCYWINWQRR